MRSKLASAAVVLGVVSGFLGCGGSTTGTGPIAESDFPDRFGQTVCSSMIQCCKTHGFAFDQTTCAATASASMRTAITNVSGEKVRYDAAAAGRCLDAYQTVLQGCGSSADTRDSACAAVLVGTVPQGGACTDSQECVAPSGGSASCENGVCAPNLLEQHAAANAPCSGTCTQDGGALSCSGFALPGGSSGGTTGSAGASTGSCYTNDGLACGPSGVCVALPKLGASCADVDQCAAGAFCDDSGTCVPQRDTGPCPSFDACTSASYCDATQQCAPKKPNGAACTSGEECVAGSCDTGQCGETVPVDADLCAGNLK